MSTKNVQKYGSQLISLINSNKTSSTEYLLAIQDREIA